MNVFAFELRKSGLLRVIHQFVGSELRIGPAPGQDCVLSEDLIGEAVNSCLTVGETGVSVVSHSGPSTTERAIAPHAFGEWFAFGDAWIRIVEARKRDGTSICSDTSQPAWVAPEIHVTSLHQRQVILLADSMAELVVGSNNLECDVVIQNDIRVSGRHARLHWRAPNSPSIEDLESRHGTYLNGERISEKHKLAHGDQLRIGSTSIRFVHYAEVLGLQPTNKTTNDVLDAQEQKYESEDETDLLEDLEEECAVVDDCEIGQTEPSHQPIISEESSLPRLFAIGTKESFLIITTAVLMCLLAWMTTQLTI